METPYYEDDVLRLHHGDATEIAKSMPSKSVQTIVTSPPYFGLRDYGTAGEIGSEETPEEFVTNLVHLFACLRDSLTDDGTLWLNLGDSYSGSGGNGQTNGRLKGRAPENKRNRRDSPLNGGLPPRNLMGMPWRVALALQADGWWLRQEIIWRKPNGLPTNAPDRYESRHEHLFLLSKSSHYWFEDDSRGQGDVWTFPTESLPGAHVAVMSRELARKCVLAGSRAGDVVLDPFSGSGTTGMVALQEGRKYVGIDLSRDYLDLSLRTRFGSPPLDFGSVA